MTNDQQTMRKVFVPIQTEHGTTREYFWAHRVGEDTARIDNVPFFTDEVGFGDLVRVGESGQVLQVLERTTLTLRAFYDASTDSNEALREWRSIRDHFAGYGIEAESARAGMFAMAVPESMTDEQFQEAYEQRPVPLTLLNQESGENTATT